VKDCRLYFPELIGDDPGVVLLEQLSSVGLVVVLAAVGLRVAVQIAECPAAPAYASTDQHTALSAKTAFHSHTIRCGMLF